MRSSDEKLFAGLVHLTIFLNGWGIFIALIVYLLQKGRSSFVARHSMQSFIYQVTLLVLAVIFRMMGIGRTYLLDFLDYVVFGQSFDFLEGLATLIGIVLLVFFVIIPVWASIRGFQGRPYRYPLVGKFVDRWL